MEQAPPPDDRSRPPADEAPGPEPLPGGPTPAAPTLARRTDGSPDWPPWFGFVGFLGAIVCTLIASGIVLAIAGVDEGDNSPAIVVVATLIQGIFFVGAALVLGRAVAAPRPWQFGLRRAPLWRTVGWAALGMLAFYVLTAVYAAIVQPDAEQDVVDSLGANDGTLGLVAAGLMVMVVAPFVEEFFFRGFFYRALRTRYPIYAAAVVNGAIFGIIHFSFDGADALLILPPLMFLGAIFCLVYEKTGSLWSVIGMHAFNNAVAFSAQVDDGWRIAVFAGPLMLAACIVLPRLMRDGPSPFPPARERVDPNPQLSLPVE
ncbi:MAG: CPBP family intramembrane metalloprotease [Solirubrobacterales bacterium]|nr:CPBP family intramembrane metalloprotease [Solirubrobacterales bacterium]